MNQTKRINILCGHLGEILEHQNLIDQLDNKFYLTFELYNTTPLIEERMVKHSTLDPYMYVEQKLLYRKENICKLLEIPKDQVFIFPLECLESGEFDKFNEFTQSVFDITLPEECKEMHTTWFSRNFG